MKRDVVFVLLGVILMTVFLSVTGCASMTKANVQAFADLVDRMDARGSATLHDPACEAYVYHETGVGVRLKGVHAQGAAQGTPSPIDGKTGD